MIGCLSPSWCIPRIAPFAMAAAVVLFGVPTASPAQGQAQQEEETVASADVTDAEVEQFARSLEDILAIQETLKEELASAQDPEEAQQLQEQANQSMVAAIQDQGLDLDRYNQIARSLAADAELNGRVQEKRQELANADSD